MIRELQPDCPKAFVHVAIFLYLPRTLKYTIQGIGLDLQKAAIMAGFTKLVPLASRRIAWRSPDIREERGELVLMVWGDIPYWTVLGKDLEEFLQAMDGSRTVSETIALRPEWVAQRKDILASLQTLRAGGVLSDQTSKPLPKPPLYDTKIENVALNITRQCNLRCRFCYNLPYLTKDNSDELTAGEMVSFLRDTKPFLGKNPVLTILGGEPLTDPEKLLTVCEHAIKQRFTVLVSTNGTQVTDRFAAQAAKLGIQMQVSLDGHTAALNDAVRGKGAFENAVEGVRTLVRNKAHTVISMVCHRGNLAHLSDFFKFARKLGADEARFIPLKKMGGAVNAGFDPVPLDELLLRAFEMFKAHPEYLALAGRDAFSIQASICRYSSRRSSCGTGLQTVLLDADGAVYPCLNTNQQCFRIGSVRDPSYDFRSLWLNSPVLAEVRRQTALHEPGQEHAGCPVRYWCLGGCRGENRALTGGLQNRPPHCAELRRGVIEMFWMLAERPDMVKISRKTC